MTTRTYLRSAGTFFTSGDTSGGSRNQPMPTVVVRQDSKQTTTVGVHVRGSFKVEAGKVSNGVSVMLDPTALRRKMAIEQMHRDINGIPSAKTTTKR